MESKGDGGTCADHLFQGIGRLRHNWVSTYKYVIDENHSLSVAQEAQISQYELRFYVVETLENGEQQELITVFSMVPSSWVSSDLRNMLYPQPNFTVGGKQPSDWGEKTFKRHQCPLTSWIEYDIQKIFNSEKPVKFNKALKALKNINGTRGKCLIADLFISESEIACGRGQRKKTVSKRCYNETFTEENTVAVSKNSDKQTILALKNSEGTLRVDEQDDRDSPQQPSKLFRPFCSSSPKQVPETELLSNCQQNTKEMIGALNVDIMTCNMLPLSQPLQQHLRDTSSISWPPNLNDREEFETLQYVPKVCEGRPSLFVSTYGGNTSNLNSRISLDHLSTDWHGNDTGLETTSSFLSQKTDVQSDLCKKTAGFENVTDVAGEKFNSQFLKLIANLEGKLEVADQTGAVILNTLQDVLRRMDSMVEKFQIVSTECQLVKLECQALNNEFQKARDEFQASFNAVLMKINEIGVIESPRTAQQNIDFHQQVVDENLKDLPCATVDSLTALNVVLQEEQVSISLVCYLTHIYKDSININCVVNQLYRKLVSDETSQNLQWKPSPRTNDFRPGLGGLFQFLAVFGVALNSYTKMRNLSPVPIGKLVELIKNSRKMRAAEFRKRNSICPVAAAAAVKESRQKITTPSSIDDDFITHLNMLIKKLETSVNSFRLPRSV